MKKIKTILLLLWIATSLSATNYFVAVNGNDSNTGTIDSPFATLRKAQEMVVAGDTVYIRQGTYRISQDEIMNFRDPYHCVFDMDKSGTGENNRICYWGYQNERPVFDLSNVKPDGRISVFYVRGNWLHFKNFEVIGTQVTVVGHTQSEAFSNRGGSNNIYEYLTVRDGMAIGFYFTQGSHNLVLNCDAYNNYDTVSDGGYGGNVDGFGGHLPSTAHTDVTFRGCRAWYNSDDGFDLINCFNAAVIEDCWSFYNGYQPGTFTRAGDGSGFKSGGYGMSVNPSVPAVIPRHVVQNCIAYYNAQQGFYANHHLGGINFYNNTGYMNPSNFNMLCREEPYEAKDVNGYGHIIKNNLSFNPRNGDNYHIINVNRAECEIANNSFLPTAMNVTEDDFVSIDPTELMAPRKADGSLPDINFLRLKTTSNLWTMRLGSYANHQDGIVNPYDWVQAPALVIDNSIVKIVGVGAEQFTRLYIDNQEVEYDTTGTDISSFSGVLEIKATTEEGGVTKLKVSI